MISNLNQRKILFIFLLFLIFSTLLISLNTARSKPTKKTTAATNLTTITYLPSSEDFANPERGFYKQSNIFVDQPFSSGKISVSQSSDSLVWVYFHLENYRDPDDASGKLFCPYFNPCDSSLGTYQGKPLEPIGSGKGLDTVYKTFAEARNKGLKLIIRFLYIGYGGIGSNSDPKTSQPDAPLSLVQEHLNQLAPLLRDNKDVIAAYQFGMVGYWGEWHSSKYLYTLSARNSVMNAVLAATPKDRMVQVRYPRYKQAFFGGPLTEQEAYNQSDLARIGLHDDAFLKDDTDDGTFKSTAGGTKVTNYCDGFPSGETACWRDYFNKDSRFVAVSGEAGTHSPTPSQYAHCPGLGYPTNVIEQMEKMHFNSIHDGYSKVTLNTWINEGCMPEVRRRLGYRFVLKNLSLSQQVSPGALLTFNLGINNEGFASPFNPRPVILVLKEKTTGQQREIPIASVDPRRWWPGQTTNVNLQVPIPSNLPQGTYNLYLWLPDTAQNLKSNPAYAVRFANQNVWQTTSGMNLIYDNLIVSGTPVTITATNTPTPGGSVPGDTNGDSKVNLTDFVKLASNFGKNLSGASNGDFNNDNIVNLSDFVILASNWTG